tara:strand:- start:15139 stop:16182 length:1044 start_codon:yes stop_codon:yes gene_type:complete
MVLNKLSKLNNEIYSERLKVKHIKYLTNKNIINKKNWLINMSIQSSFEGFYNLLEFLNRKYIRVSVAIENNNIIGYITFLPYNRKSTSILISIPEIIINNPVTTDFTIYKSLIQHVIDQNKSIKSLLLFAPESNDKLITASRELGFQPIKTLRRWQNKTLDLNKENECKDNLDNLLWQSINKNNINSAWKLNQSNETPFLREIIEIEPSDLLDRMHGSSSLLSDNSRVLKESILGILYHPNYKNSHIYNLIRDLAIDHRIKDKIIPKISELFLNNPSSIIQISSNDEYLNDILDKNNYIERESHVLLVKSILNRQVVNKSIFDKTNIRSFFGEEEPPTLPQPLPINY